jgi:mitochondrial chaperone BCS1
MSLHSVRHLKYGSNDTSAAGFAHLPITMLDAFIPGYSVIVKYILDVVDFDISTLVSILFLGFACATGFDYLYRYLWSTFLVHFTASVTIDAWDTIYDNLLAWASEQEELKRIRSLRLHSADYKDEVDELRGDASPPVGAIFNFNRLAAKIPPNYEPDLGFHWFHHKGHWFKLSRETVKVQSGYRGMMIHHEEKITITVVGRSTKPIKDLIIEIRDKRLSKQTAQTTIYRPSPREQRVDGRQWKRVAVRPSRPMSTVVLDDEQKGSILIDVNDFLDPATAIWYSSRGIPYRRGYLLQGPPGTGKTSLSFALGGVFGLDIYCMSLSEKTLSEEDIILLFNTLPKRCIILLEDIDRAGVARENPLEEKGASNQGGITMSGLLNAIDGVASPEGRVLIMTTNHPKMLDKALIRPGRVDMQINFTLASRKQIRELFLRMYCVGSREATRQPTNLAQIMPESMLRADEEKKKCSAERRCEQDSNGYLKIPQPSMLKKLFDTPPMTTSSTAHLRKSSISLPMTPTSRSDGAANLPLQGQPTADVEKLADIFADSLPEATFSPAEIQGFLLVRKKSPWTAVAEVEMLTKKKTTEVKEGKGDDGDLDVNIDQVR